MVLRHGRRFCSVPQTIAVARPANSKGKDYKIAEGSSKKLLKVLLAERLLWHRGHFSFGKKTKSFQTFSKETSRSQAFHRSFFIHKRQALFYLFLEYIVTVLHLFLQLSGCLLGRSSPWHELFVTKLNARSSVAHIH